MSSKACDFCIHRPATRFHVETRWGQRDLCFVCCRDYGPKATLHYGHGKPKPHFSMRHPDPQMNMFAKKGSQ